MTNDAAADEFIRRLEAAYGNRRGAHTATAVCVTGQPYVTFGFSGPVDGAPPVSDMEIDDLIAHAVANVLERFKEVPYDTGTVYWRIRPQITDDGAGRRFRVRLLIGDGAAIGAQTPEEKAWDVMARSPNDLNPHVIDKVL